jgi:benzylsuccinate CoA-transferase BbsF subunit
MNGVEHKRQGNHDTEMSPHSVFPAEGHDQWIAIAVSSDDEWQTMCEVMGRPELARDRRFADLVARKKNEVELDGLIAEWTKRDSPYALMNALQAKGVAAAPVMSVFDLVESRHLRERGYFVEIDHPEVGPRMTPGIPAKFGGLTDLHYYPAPTLGQHNEYVFKEIVGLDDATFDRLVADKVIH